MSSTDKAERIERLRRSAAERSALAEARVQRALMKMRSQGARASIETVAAEAGASTSYIAKHKGLRDEVKNLRREQRVARNVSDNELTASNASARVQLDIVRDRLRVVEAENVTLRRENETLRGEVLALGRKARLNARRA